MMSALIGVSLGSATGISLAIVSTPADAVITLNDLRQIHFIGNEAPVKASTNSSASVSASPSASSSAVQHALPSAPVQTVATASQSATVNNAVGAAGSASDERSTISAVKMQHLPATQPGPGKIPVVDDNDAPIHPASPIESRPAKPAVHPITKTPRVLLASISDDQSAPSSDGPMSLEGDAKPPTFYSEGDLTIADYDAAKGTIETLDGQTFVLGLTISSTDATGWEDYRSSVHYRCSQDGSCTLTRLGVVAPNARLI
jgi:hypothetical protein